MRQRLLWLAAGLIAAPAIADESPPTIDLLLYLADWQPDAKGMLTDPLEVPDEPYPEALPAPSSPQQSQSPSPAGGEP